MDTVKFKQIALLFSTLLFACFADAQGMDDKTPIDSVTILQRMKAENIPAVGVAYIEDGRVKDIHVYGEIKRGVPAPFNTVFNVASITKTVTSLVTLRLIDAGKWSLDEPVCHYWTDPDVRDDPRSKKLTTRHILTHQTGFPNWRWMSASKKLSFEFEPGARFQYSGEGMEYLRRALGRGPWGKNDCHYLTQIQTRFADLYQFGQWTAALY